MNWQTKALIQRNIARFPQSERLYKVIQKRFGTLDSDPWFRIPQHMEMLGAMREVGFYPAGKVLFEVGTGHKPYMALGFGLLGAAKVITVDLNPRFDASLFGELVRGMIDQRQKITEAYAEFIDPAEFMAKIEALEPWVDRPLQLLPEVGVDYRAPADAARTGLADESVDCHFSVTTMEHIGPQILTAIFAEAMRILKPGGLAVHQIDLSDHFQHNDKSITKINFLKFSDKQWEYLAGNRFGYTNRMRASQFRELFKNLGFETVLERTILNQESLEALRGGLEIDQVFEGLDAEDLCTTRMVVVLRKPA